MVVVKKATLPLHEFTFPRPPLTVKIKSSVPGFFANPKTGSPTIARVVTRAFTKSSTFIQLHIKSVNASTPGLISANFSGAPTLAMLKGPSTSPGSVQIPARLEVAFGYSRNCPYTSISSIKNN